MKSKQTVVLSICFILVGLSAFARDWTQFRGPGGAASSAETGLPVTWSQTENIRWKVALPGRGLSNPVIAKGRVYVTACTGWQQDRLHVLCFDVRDGKKLWERQLWATGNTMCHPKTCMAAPTPATDGERVYALFATADVACLDAEGNLLWYRSLAGDYPSITNQVGMAASPVLHKDLLILPMENAGDSFVAALDKLTGENRWKRDRARSINWCTPLLVTTGGRDYVLFQSGGGLAACDPATGEKVWGHDGGLGSSATPAVGEGLVFAAGGNIVALRPQPDKASAEVVWKSNRLKTDYASPLYYQGRVYAINSANILTCGDAKDGKIVWQQRLTGPFWSSPVAADGKLYLVNEEGTTSVLQIGDEPRVLSKNPLGETILATPAIADGAIFLRSDQHLYCIAEKKTRPRDESASP